MSEVANNSLSKKSQSEVVAEIRVAQIGSHKDTQVANVAEAQTAQPVESSHAAHPQAPSEESLDVLLKDISALESITQDWPDEYKLSIEAHANAIDALNAAAFRRLIRQLKDQPGFASALREAATDDVVYAVLRRHGILKASLFERVEAALDTVRPMLASHGGNVELVSVKPPMAEVRFLGACDGCPASALTFYSGVKKAIQDHVPEISDIKQIKGLAADLGTANHNSEDKDKVHFTSPFAAYASDGWTYACELSEVSEGETKMLEVDSHSVLLSRFEDSLSCFENSCAHMGLAMDGGEIKDGIMTCPYHQFRYSLQSGECLTAPEVQLQPHGVRVVGSRIELRLTS